MPLNSWSERYAIAAAIGLLLLVALNNVMVMVVVSALGLAVGLIIAWRSNLRRAGVIALAAFAVAGALGIMTLLRR